MATAPRRVDASLPCRLTCPPLSIAARLTSSRSAPVLVSVHTREPLVALTFDDGPDPATTPALLQVLSRHMATATFFLIGERAAAHPELVADIVSEGHELGNHLWLDRPSVRLTRQTFRAELSRTGEELSRHGTVRWFRPGSGMYTPRMLHEATDLGYQCVLGSPWLLATTYRTNSDGRGSRMGDRAHPGAIAILHEGTPARAAVAPITDGLLRRLGKRGLRAVNVSDLVGPRGTQAS